MPEAFPPSEAAPERRLAAVFFADLVGYSRLAAEDEDRAMRLLQIFHEAARTAISACGGTLVKTVGDAAFAEFPSTEKAVRSALSLRNGFSARAASEQIPTELRIGVHVGDVVTSADGDLYGDGVNLAARLQTAAAPGEVLASEDVWRQLRQRKEYRFEAVGKRELKGQSEPMRVYAASLAEGDGSGGDPARTTTLRPRAGRSRRLPFLAGITVLLLLAFGAYALRSLFTPPAAEDASIAVLPFENLGADPEQEYFSDGMTEDLLMQLSKVGELRVISRTSAMQYKGTEKPLQQISDELGVTNILAGSVRREGTRVRVSAQLVDARTDEALWAEQYDRELSDIFAVQEEIAREIVRALGATLSDSEHLRLAAPRTANLDAYTLYLKGRHAWNRRTEEGLEQAVEYFREAIRVEPSYAEAYAGLADAYLLLGTYDFRASEDVLPNARNAAERAIRLDPALADAYTSLAGIITSEMNFARAERTYRKAIALQPSSSHAHHRYGVLLAILGRTDAALQEIRRARELDPLSLTVQATLGRVLVQAGDPDEAIAQMDAAIELDPDFPWAHYALGLALAKKKRFVDARSAFRAALRRVPDFPRLLASLAAIHALNGERQAAREILDRMRENERTPPDPYSLALVHTALGESDPAFELLQDLPWHSEYLLSLRSDPLLDPIRSDPRYYRLLDSLRIR